MFACSQFFVGSDTPWPSSQRSVLEMDPLGSSSVRLHARESAFLIEQSTGSLEQSNTALVALETYNSFIHDLCHD